MKINNNIMPLGSGDVSDRQKKLEDQLHGASEMYEQHFLGEMVKAMRTTVHKDDGFIPTNMAENIFSEKLDQQYVEKWAGKGGIGLADLIYKQMHERLFPQKNLAPPSGPVPLRKGAVPFDVKVQKTGEDKGQILFRGQPPSETSGKVPGTPGQVTAPWKGRVESAMTDADGWSHVTLKHENQMRSELAYRGQLAALDIGAEVEEGDPLGALATADPVLRWNLSAI